MLRAKKGDHGAFDALVRPEVDRLYGLAGLLLSDRSRAEDAVQEGLLNAWRDLPKLRDADRFGAWLRRSHVDELPQVVNILRGHLSIVGPRPEQPRYVEELEGKIPFYRLRDLVRPGLTGWAQVKYPYGANELDAIEKLQYEFYYLRHQGLGLDLRITGRTLRSVLGRGGR